MHADACEARRGKLASSSSKVKVVGENCVNVESFLLRISRRNLRRNAKDDVVLISILTAWKRVRSPRYRKMNPSLIR